MIDGLLIRPAAEQDAPLILEMIKELAVYERLLPEVKATEEMLLQNIFIKKYAEVVIVEYCGKTAGQALFFHNFSTFVGKPGIYLEDIYIRPEFRGKGIGKEVLLYLIDLAKKRNCGRVEWAVLDWNEPAIEFYKKLGAVQMDEWSIFRLVL